MPLACSTAYDSYTLLRISNKSCSYWFNKDAGRYQKLSWDISGNIAIETVCSQYCNNSVALLWDFGKNRNALTECSVSTEIYRSALSFIITLH